MLTLGMLFPIINKYKDTYIKREEESSNNLQIQSKEQIIMKYKNITIKKNLKCNTWYARYRFDGKQYYVSGKTQKEAYDKLKQQIIKLNNIKKLSLEYNFEQWYLTWLKTYKEKSVKESTLKDYNNSYKYLMKLNNKKLKDITNLMITELLNEIKFERRKQKVYELLRDLFNKAEQNKLIESNPMVNIKKPKHISQTRISFSKKDQMKLEKCNNEKYIIFKIAMFQGLRRGEVLALTLEDFDLVQKTLRINKSINDKNEIDLTKNESSNRVMPLFEKTIKEIKKLKIKNQKERLFKLSPTMSEKLFCQMKEEMNLNNKYTIHSLRHTFITTCQEKLIPLHVIQSWVGHVIGSKITTGVYTHKRETELEYINNINE